MTDTIRRLTEIKRGFIYLMGKVSINGSATSSYGIFPFTKVKVFESILQGICIFYLCLHCFLVLVSGAEKAVITGNECFYFSYLEWHKRTLGNTKHVPAIVNMCKCRCVPRGIYCKKLSKTLKKNATAGEKVQIAGSTLGQVDYKQGKS